MKTNSIGNPQRNVVRKMFEGSELFYWQRTSPKTFHLSKLKSGEFGTTGETVKKGLVAAIEQQGLITQGDIRAGRVFYVLTEKGKNLCR